MSEEYDEEIFIPTKEEKNFLDERCNNVIELLSDLPLVQKAYVLSVLMTSFEKLTGTKLMAMSYGKEKGGGE